MQFKGVAIDQAGGRITRAYAQLKNNMWAQAVVNFSATEVDDLEFNYTSGLAPLTGTPAAVIIAAVPGVRHSVTSLQMQNTNALVSSDVTLLSGTTVIWSGRLAGLASIGDARDIVFPKPLRTAPNEALSIKLANGLATVLWNVQGYESAVLAP